ncbi:unnamed protein product [Mesocestoides corti]|uniref:Uncharacterized protein n=1 Tax=Mesocestoides corti TaxID=53468 RepID=A0A0R3UDS2_MESCO|nr:unnamed protein product [Mesocestoides corti]
MVCKGRLKRLTTPAAEYLQHTPISTRAVNVVDDGGRSSPQIPAIASFRNPKIWLSAFFSKKFRRDPAELDDHSGIDVAVKVSLLMLSKFQ